LVASETALEESWSHRIAICLPSEASPMSRRRVVTELGPDDDALRPQDRAATLIDLGLEPTQVDICVRTADPGVLESLRAHLGRSIFESDGVALNAIRRMSLDWVIVSRAGRAEAYWPATAADEASGARVHVLSKLLGLRRTHATTEPIPAGLVPFAHCHPPHPGSDAHGRVRPFDHACHAAFQSMLHAFGDPQLNALKDAVVAAVMAGRMPDSVPLAKSRHARGCVRVALRQLQASGVASATLADWIAAYSGGSRTRER
jgi:hypothetical protein